VTAPELAAAYTERWEYEMSLREIQTQVPRPGTGLGSESPGMVRLTTAALALVMPIASQSRAGNHGH
jgi:hypothetical protein